MLSDETSKETKGRVFGFHRAMDTLGAALGPIIALIYLYYYPENYKTLFFMAFIPGVIAVLFTFFIKDKPREPKLVKGGATFFFSGLLERKSCAVSKGDHWFSCIRIV